ncbi:CsbD family protein [Bradyrhizobium sp. LHD-71]|uniref:CsbD family protein n=1 Tax=Bradyrhizobium sp. LHD-71 TaxID=3072141 RepID=UPI00280F373F|nr:CsbD family protein [Bradyrhizobium sp. LHD-71]MDQ8729403.1 CsbD family protein [Bradyrhizobium sp. LHD-71]
MILPVSNCGSNALVRVASNPFPAHALCAGVKDLNKLGRAAEKVAGKSKQAVAEVTGDGKLDEEGRRQVKRAEQQTRRDEAAEQAERAETPKLSTIANNLT